MKERKIFKILSAILFSLSSTLLSASDVNWDIDNASPTIKVMETVCTAEGKAGSGERLYFGLEKITSENQNNWQRFGIFSSWHALTADYIVASIARDDDDSSNYSSLDKDLAQSYLSSNEIQGNAGQAGFTVEEYKSYIKALVENPVENRDFTALSNFTIGTQGFQFYGQNPYYVAYVSKTPITGPFLFPKDMRTCNTKKYVEHFSNLLMAVRCEDISNTAVYYNRWIFKNPQTIIAERGYAGLSTRLHGFTAWVFEEMLAKKYMAVGATVPMYKIMEKKAQSLTGDFYVRGISYRNGASIPMDLKNHTGGAERKDVPCVFPTTTLKEFVTLETL